MQHKVCSRCIDPKLLNLNEHLDSARLAYDCSAPFDDVEIATGQASFDDDDGDIHPQMSTWINPHHSCGTVEESDDGLAGFDYKPTQAHSAPAREWEIGRFERSDSSAVLQYEGSSLVRGSEPWSHLQTFALSAPGHDDQCSRDFQIEAISQWPSSLQDNDILHFSTPESRHQPQASAKPKRMQENPYSAEGYGTSHPHLHNQARSARSLQLGSFDMFEDTTSRAGDRQMADSSTSSSFSQNATSGPHPESQSLNSQSAYPLRDPNFDELKGSNKGRLHQNLEVDLSLDSGLFNEPERNSLLVSPNVLTPQKLSWGQQDQLLFGHQLSTSSDTAYGSYDLGFTANDHAWHSDFMQHPTFGFTTGQNSDDSNKLDQPGAIRIEGSSGHYKSGLPSSFPPTADCFPDYVPIAQKHRRHRAIASTSQPTLNISNKSTSARGSRSGSLSIIREYGHLQQGSPVLSRNGSAKGKRKGPLNTATALAAAQKRKDGNVCIRCRTMKMTCKGGLPCEGCRQITKVKFWDQACTPANFTDMVRGGTCNAVFQYCISHLALDGNRRLVVPVPTAFSVSKLLERLESCRLRYDIRVRHSSGSSFTLYLSNCFRLLMKIYKSCALDNCELQDFVSNKQLRLAWLQCVREYDLATGVVVSLTQVLSSAGVSKVLKTDPKQDRSIQWNNMPERNSYEVLPQNTLVPGRVLDVEDQEDQSTIVFAAQLSRIILRALEVEAFETLQKSVNELIKGGKPNADIESLIGQLGQILMSLRWRISWWAVIGDSPNESCISRVTKLAQILYCYYFVARKKTSSSSDQLPGNIHSVYADIEPVYEELPLNDSLDGFHAWMQKGQAVVQAAKVQQNITSSLPITPVNPQF